MHKTWMSHEERRLRRRDIAKFLEEDPSRTVADAAEKFGVGEAMVEIIINAAGLNRYRSIPSANSYAILKDMYVVGMNDAEIVKKYLVTKQRANQIRQAARKGGWEV